MPAIHYSLVSQEKDTLEGILGLFKKAGATEESVKHAKEKWGDKNYLFQGSNFGNNLRPDMVFKMGHPGKCPYGFNK